jgi:hypothetical protein
VPPAPRFCPPISTEREPCSHPLFSHVRPAVGLTEGPKVPTRYVFTCDQSQTIDARCDCDVSVTVTRLSVPLDMVHGTRGSATTQRPPYRCRSLLCAQARSPCRCPPCKTCYAPWGRPGECRPPPAASWVGPGEPESGGDILDGTALDLRRIDFRRAPKPGRTPERFLSTAKSVNTVDNARGPLANGSSRNSARFDSESSSPRTLNDCSPTWHARAAAVAAWRESEAPSAKPLPSPSVGGRWRGMSHG